MNENSRIRALYIQGCARSGNTLMRELCGAAYRNTELVKVNEKRSECLLERMVEELRAVEMSGSKKLLVASRNRRASAFMDLELLRCHPEIGVVWMIRNPLDVLTSKHKKQSGFYVEPYRLIASLNLYAQFRNEPNVLTVRYEDLVSEPAKVQAEITQRFGLDEHRAFCDCHEFFPKFRQNVEALHSIRPIDSNSVEKWKSKPELRRYLCDTVRDFPEFVDLGKLYGGYEIDTKALKSAAKADGPLKGLQSLLAPRGRQELAAATGGEDDD